MEILKRSLFFIFYFSSSLAHAQNFFLTENFNSLSNKDSSDFVWNIALGELHPGLVVFGWSDGVVQSTNYTVGDGRHGAFRSDRYSQFTSGSGSIVGTTIYIDTDYYPELQVTEFTLEAGWTLRPVGSNPLVIRSLSTIQVDGVINCSGEPGQNAVANPAVQLSGGLGRCGAGNGGASVVAGAAPGATHQGQAGGFFVTGGEGGGLATISGGQGGGGGGAYIKNFAAAPDKPDPEGGVNPAGGAGGLAGTIYRDDAFQDDLSGAGSGGGGGSAYNDAGNVAAHSSGASGGGGGGNIQMYAVGNVTLSATGEILANGGDGGDAQAPYFGGAGGGGAGGSILIFAGGDIQLDSPVTAMPGAGGLSSSGGSGGDGAWGRTWIVEKDGYANGVIEDPVTNLNLPGDVRFVTGVAIVESKVIDIGNTKPVLRSSDLIIEDQGTSTLSLEISHCLTTEASSCEAYVDPVTLEDTLLGRYLRFRLTIDNDNATVPIRVSSLSFEFTGNKQTEFDFAGSCARIESGGTPPLTSPLTSPQTPPLYLSLLLLPLLLVGVLKFKPSFTN